MAKVITFSRTFPAYHPKKGQPTYFVEKFIKSWDSLHTWNEVASAPLIPHQICNHNMFPKVEPKHHTIRAGHRFKAGDYFSPRTWGDNINPKTGRKGPYHSNQITIAPDTLIVKTWDFELKVHENKLYGFINGNLVSEDLAPTLASNDGLSVYDMNHWFTPNRNIQKCAFKGQIICWNESINY